MSALKEVLPKFGLVYSDRGQLAEVMSKPKLIPVKVECSPASAAPCTQNPVPTRPFSAPSLPPNPAECASVKELEKREKALAAAFGGSQ